MKDKLTLDRIELLHPKIKEEVRSIYIDEVCKSLTGRAICRFAYTLRTFAEQDALFAQGRTRLFDTQGKRLGVITQARGGQSFHNYGLAFDIVLLTDNDRNGSFESASWDTIRDFDNDKQSDWMEVVNIFKKHGYTWGGDFKRFKDAPHFEKTFGFTHQQLLRLHNNKNFIPGTTYVNI